MCGRQRTRGGSIRALSPFQTSTTGGNKTASSMAWRDGGAGPTTSRVATNRSRSMGGRSRRISSTSLAPDQNWVERLLLTKNKGARIGWLYSVTRFGSALLAATGEFWERPSLLTASP